MSGGGLFGGWLDPVGRAFMNEISALTKETPDSSHTSSTMWGHCVEMVIYESGSRILPDIASASALILNFQPPEPWEINLCCLWAIHSMTFCYSSLKELRHWARCSIFLSLVPDLENKMKITCFIVLLWRWKGILYAEWPTPRRYPMKIISPPLLFNCKKS